MIAITGATGHLGRLTLQALLQRGIPAEQIVALVRAPAKAADLTEQGVQVRQADYHQPDTLRSALQGVQKLLLISTSDFNDRVGQHRNVIEAAREAGVGLLAYTSGLNMDTSTMLLAADHQATEGLLRESGLPYVLLRNGWYSENYTNTLAQTLASGAMLGSGGEGPITLAARQDLAEAAAAVMATDGHENKVYELGGDEALTLSEIATAIGQQSGQTVVYQDLPLDALTQVYVGAGLPEPMAGLFADSAAAIGRGEWATDSGDLRRLIGRSTTSFTDVLAAALKS